MTEKPRSLSAQLILIARAAFVPLCLWSQGVQAADESAPSTPIVEPLKIQVPAPEWPGAMGREAVVSLEFDVLADGSVSNIRVSDEGFHEKRFVEASIRALKGARVTPRRINGEAVEVRGLRQRFLFGDPEQQQGIHKDFQRELKKVEKLIRSGDIPAAEHQAQWMLSEKVRLRYEYAVLQSQLAVTYAENGNVYQAIRAARLATVRLTQDQQQLQFLQVLASIPPNSPSNYLLATFRVIDLLKLRMRLAASQGLLLEALQSYYELAGLVRLEPDDPIMMQAKDWTAKILGNDPLVGKRELVGENTWILHDLSRRRFRIVDTESADPAFSLQCSVSVDWLLPKTGDVYEIPAHWGNCKIMLRGKPGKKLEIVELADNVAASSSAATPIR
jgi:hypothetical protein